MLSIWCFSLIWLLFFLTHSTVDTSALRADGAVSRCSSLLVSLGGAVSKGTKEEGMELVRKGWILDTE